MNYQDTMPMQPNLTIAEITSIIESCEHTLRLVQASPNYQAIESSKRFSTPNDLRIGDAIQALVEVNQAIANYALDREQIENAYRTTFI